MLHRWYTHCKQSSTPKNVGRRTALADTTIMLNDWARRLQASPKYKLTDAWRIRLRMKGRLSSCGYGLNGAASGCLYLVWCGVSTRARKQGICSLAPRVTTRASSLGCFRLFFFLVLVLFIFLFVFVPGVALCPCVLGDVSLSFVGGK